MLRISVGLDLVEDVSAGTKDSSNANDYPSYFHDAMPVISESSRLQITE